MVGTGVFTSLGFQLVDIQSTFVLLMLWLVGGVSALCGAMTYAELGAALPRSGGEYNFLTRIYHPAAGFVSGWISATVGFTAPTALAAVTFGTYLGAVDPRLSPTWLAVGLIVAFTLIHVTNHRSSGRVQIIITLLKIALIVLFCVLALVLVDDPQTVRLLPRKGDGALLTSGAFAVSLIYVSYAYSGWNAATYLSSEVNDPQRNLPRVLATGTLVVMLMYFALNYAFLYAAPMEAMSGELEVGYIAARYMFGEKGAFIMGTALAALLMSTVSAMIMAGPRVLQVIGEDFPAFSVLARTNRSGIPHVAVYVQSAIALLFVVTSTFESILVFSGFTLALNTLATGVGLFVLRWRSPELPRPYRTWGYPVTPLIFLALTGWTLVFVLLQKPLEALLGIALVVGGLVFYYFARPRQ